MSTKLIVTVDDAIDALIKIKNKGDGGLPLQLMVIENGITYAEQIVIQKAQKYDGKRVWIYGWNRVNDDGVI